MSKKKSPKTAKATKARTRAPTAKRKKSNRADKAPEAPAAPPKPTKVNIAAAKGRPMLTWVGKRPLSHVTAFPAQLVERHDALRIVGIDAAKIDADDEKMQLFRDLRSQCNEECWKNAPFIGTRAPEIGGLLFHGDNKDVLAYLLATGFRRSTRLIYIDPPFDSGADYIRKVALRGPVGATKLEGESYAIGEQLQYTDIWANDNYLQFMYDRLLLLRELLKDDGAIYVQCDPRRSHHLRCLLDEVLGANGFIGEIVWRRSTAHSDAKHFGAIHDVLLYYSPGDGPLFNRQFTTHDKTYIESHYANVDEHGRRFLLDNITSPHPRPNLTYVWKGYEPPQFGWRYSKEKMEELDLLGRIHYPEKGGRPRLKRYLDELEGVPLQDVWDDLNPVNSQASEAVGFPTQKPESLLERIISVSTDPGDLVLDCFLG
ncbi:MAG: site-specific DNA-methyltransferase, partial [Thermoguttaceae bacterium]